MAIIIKKRQLVQLYSYNQLKSIYGSNDKQVRAIKKYLKNGLGASINFSLQAFSRINN